MKKPDPKVDSRRAEALYAELLTRSQGWMPKWQPTGKEPDFGHALLRIAARIGSEVTERLDRTPAKMALGLLDWLGITRRSGYAARMPVVFKMAEGATDPVLAPARVRIQANAGDTPISFETTDDVQLVPSPVTQLVGVDPDADAIYFPPSNVLSLESPTPGPTVWTVKSLASAQSTTLQLTPPLGLEKDTILLVDGLEYRIVAKPDGDIVTIEPPVGTRDPGSAMAPTGTTGDIAEDKTAKKVTEFIPFGGTSRNRQEHVLYIGDDDALKLTSPQPITIMGGASMLDGIQWEYWGKLDGAAPKWNPLYATKTQAGDLQLKFRLKDDKTSVSIESTEIEGRNSRWIRASRGGSNNPSVPIQELRLKINCSGTSSLCSEASNTEYRMPEMFGVANNTSLVLNERFYPLGKTPRLLDSFYLACEEAFSKPEAKVCIHFNMADPTLGPIAIVKGEQSNEFYVYGIGTDGYLHRYLLYEDKYSQKTNLKYIGLTRPSDQRFTAADHTRPPVVIIQNLGTSVLVWSDNIAWIWEQTSNQKDADLQWHYFGSIGIPEQATITIKQIKLIGQTSLIAIGEDGSLWYRTTDSGGNWNGINAVIDGDGVTFKWIVPVYIGVGEEIRTVENVFFAIGINNKKKIGLFRFVFSNGSWSPIVDDLPNNSTSEESVDLASFSPLAYLINDKLLLASRSPDIKKVGSELIVHKFWGCFFKGGNLTGILINPNEKLTNPEPVVDQLKGAGAIVGSEFSWLVHYPSGMPQFRRLYLLLTIRTSASAGTPEQTRLAWWTPLDAEPSLDYEEPPPRTIGTLAQSPAIPIHSVQSSSYLPPSSYPLEFAVLVPGNSRDVLVGNFVPLQRKIFSSRDHRATLVNGIKTAATFEIGDLLETTTDGNALRFTVPPHQKVKLNSENLYVFSEADKIDGGTGTRYANQQSPGVATWVSTVPTELQLTNVNLNIDMGCILILSYKNASGETLNKICKVTSKPDKDRPNAVPVEDLTALGLPANPFDYYLYIKSPYLGGYSAYILDSKHLSLVDSIPDPIQVDWVLVFEYMDGQNKKYSLNIVKTAPQEVNKGNWRLEVNDDLPQNIPANQEITYYVYNLNLGHDLNYYAIPFSFSIKAAVFLHIENGDQEKLKTPDRVLYFLDTGANPKEQKVDATSTGTFNNSTYNFVAVLEKPWEIAGEKPLIPNPPDFAINDSKAEWAPFSADVATKPDLSWEYWNGSGWWKIENLNDGTEDLKITGNLEFNVPTNIQATDVLGRKSWWIRARLIGGDYGRESFEVTTTPPPGTSQTQTQSVVVNTDNVHAPLALGIRIAYNLCTPIAPKYLLTLDSKSLLDQSDANRTPEATVDAFVPIAERLGQMTGNSAGTAAAGVTVEASYTCDSQNSVASGRAPSSKTVGCQAMGASASGQASTGTLPKVLSGIPAAGATEVATDTLIQAAFNLSMDPSTIDNAVFELRDGNDQLVPGAVSYDAASRTAMLKPLSALAPSATYRVTIRGGDRAPQVKDLAGNPLASDVTWTFATAATSMRAIYLAFDSDKPLVGGPIRLLFLLKDRDHDLAAPLVVETLRSNRFETVLAKDETRALGETGFVTFTLDAPPSQAELFGKPGFWLRLRPATAAKAAGWSPAIRGVYVNAVWAESTESQALEILGSSDGSPLQTFTLLRPPVLRDSLELRVLEPLGEEEMEKLSRVSGTVKENVQGLPGRWVLWKEVTDPGDMGPDDRVYALDSVSGEIRFGDGEHGMIPPIGRDSIVAFAYRHGGDAAANQVPPFQPLNLVTPISGAEAVITPDSAAGGADAEDAETVKRFAAPRLRHRDRAITLRDLEDLALDFSPEFVQARAINGAQGIRLVVVMGARGQSKSKNQPVNPDPSQAQARELRNYLIEHASPALARQGNLTVVKADRLSFRIELRLRVESVDVTGSVGDAVKTKLKQLFDPGEGGWDGLGWRIGDVPSEDDIAASLIAIEGLDSIESIVFSRDDDKAVVSNRLPIAPDQLAWLVPEGIKLQFTQHMVTS